MLTGLWFLVCYVATQLATHLHQRRIEVVRSNRVAWKRPAESNGTPAMDPGHMNIDSTYTFAYCCEEDIRICRHTKKRGTEQTQIHHGRLSLDFQTMLMLSLIIMCITITIYFDFSHVIMWSLFMSRNNNLKSNV